MGARITDPAIQDRYIGKKIFDQSGNLVSVTMEKGEKRDPSLFDDHHVDGMSGATLTAKGVNSMFQDYFNAYSGFFESAQSN